MCNCQGDLVKGEDGRCVEEEVRKNQRKEKREKEKKKKRKKKKKKGNEEAEEEEGRVHYPWYYMLGPLTGSYLVYQYWRPSMLSSLGMIIFMMVSARLGPEEE